MTDQKDNGITLSQDELEKIIKDSVHRALAELGLEDASAGDDIKQIRSLLAAWNMAKRSFWKGAWDKLGTLAVGAFLFWLFARFGASIEVLK